MKENEKRLFKVLIFVIIAVIVYLVLFFNITEIQESRKSIEKYSKSIQNFKSTEKNEVVPNEIDDDFLKIDELNISDVTALILSDFEKNSIEVENYTFHEDSKQNFVDFKIKCSSKNFIDYIMTINNGSFPYSIINCIFSTQSGYIKANIRYSNEPCVIVSEEKLLYRNQLIKHLPNIISNAVIPEMEKNEMILEEPIEDGSDRFKYVGKITENNSKFLLIKTIETGKILRFDISKVEMQEDYIIVKIDNIRYKIFI